MASPNLTSQIGTNYIPSDEDIAYIRNSILPGPTAKLAELEIEIARVQDLYSSLTKHREDLLAEIDGYQNLISPARRLPIDILQEIFGHTLPTAHNALLDISECPILLTRICSGWRSIALSTPHLWSTIHIPSPSVAGNFPPHWGQMNYSSSPDDFEISALSSLKKYATTITNWLARSAASPLSISLYDPRHSCVPKEHYEIVINSFLPFANRWKHLVMDAHSPALGRIAELTEFEVPLLESLTLHDITANGGGLHTNPRQLWKTSGIVRSARLQKVHYTQINENVTQFSFKWAQLTHIKLSQVASDGWGTSSNPITALSDLVIVMSLSPRLISFHSEIGLLTSTGLVPSPSISSLPLLYLQKLVFHDGGANCKALFDLLEVPSLLHLEFFPTNDSSHSVLPTLLPRISGMILSLTTSSYFFCYPKFLPVLSQCQKLTSITIKSGPNLGADAWGSPPSFIQNFFLENLTLPANHPDRLTSALEVFECQEGVAFSDEAILGFIKVKHSRADLAPLKRISILFTRPRDFDVLLDEEVAQCISNGLVANLTYPMGLNPRVPFDYRPDSGLRRTDSRPVWPPSAAWR